MGVSLHSAGWSLLNVNRGLRRRQWWLWVSAIAIMVALVLGLLSLSSGRREWYPLSLQDLVRGLAGLVILFGCYIVYMQIEIGRIERRLAEKNELLRLTTENVADLIAVVDAEGRRFFTSPSYEKLLGYSSEELSDTLAWGQVHPEDRGRVIAAAETLRRTGEPQRLEYRFQHRNGSWRVLESISSALPNPAGQPEKFVVVNRDVTEVRNQEMQTRQAQKMEAIGRLAGSISHDFNNLLNVIIGYSDVLEHSLKGNSPGAKTSPDPQTLLKNVDQIRKAGERAAALTRQLLAFSRQQVLQPKVIDLNAVVSNVEEMLTRLIGSHVHLKIELEPGIGSVCVDEIQLEQVILNLAVNARDAMPDGGGLVIRTDLRLLDGDLSQSGFSARPGRYVSLTVSDTGLGMDAETQARIFEPFFTTKEPGKGTGLGLSTVYGIVKQSNGYIEVNSEPEKGTEFIIYLPQVDQAPKTSSPRLQNQFAPGTQRVLLVEDDNSVRGLLRRLLEQGGYAVLEADSSTTALDIARQFPGSIHLLLTEVQTRGMNGHATAAAVREIRPGTRIIYMTGYMPFRDGDVFGPEDVILQKPISRETLLKTMQYVLKTPLEVSAP